MCGIFACLNCTCDAKTVHEYFNKIKHRGPDDSEIVKKGSHVFGFHRLAINDIENGNQPFEKNGLIMICNGEIYNHKTIESNHKLQSQLETKSDCECIIHLFDSGMSSEQIAAKLDAEFAFVVYDEKTNTVHVARDAFGVRPLFWGIKDNMIAFASEMKAINYCDFIEPFLPGHSMTLNLNTTMSPTYIKNQYKRFYCFPDMINLFGREDVLATVRTLFISAVQKRVMSDRPIGCLLSGGLDSSLVAAVLNRFVPNVHLFSVQPEG
jgi:asparagine synthase (glutamine-hydrolysing)